MRAPYFYPARDGGNHQQPGPAISNIVSCESPVFLPRPGRRQNPGPEQNDTEARTRARETQRTLNDNKHVRASSTEDHATPNPTSRDRAAGQKDQPEAHGEKQKMRTTRGSTMQPGLTNRRTVTPFMLVAPTEKQVYTLASRHQQRTSGLSRSHR